MVSATRSPINPRRFIHSTGQPLADQYYHIYNARLKCARDALIKRARYRWGQDVENVPLEQLNASLGSKDVFVIGTLFKLMPNQPSILREVEGDEISTRENFTTEEDTLVLHETDENVQVVGDIDVNLHVTGTPVALLGHQLNGGAKFHVTDICYAGPNLDVYRDQPSQEGESNYLLIVSGLEFGFNRRLPKQASDNIIACLKKLRDFVHNKSHGQGGSKELSKIIIAGNSISSSLSSSSEHDVSSSKEALQLFDKYLFDLAQSGVNITLMPGKNDPTSFLLPQQPFHPKILPQSGLLENVHPDTNPSLMEFEDRIILGTSGENVEAIMKHSKIEFSTTALKNTLEWGHIAPSAPDNLSCLPFKSHDPFIIDFIPDIYFAGNQPEFTVTTYSCENRAKIQLISVPSFVTTQTCVLVNLTNLDCELVDFRQETT